LYTYKKQRIETSMDYSLFVFCVDGLKRIIQKKEIRCWENEINIKNRKGF